MRIDVEPALIAALGGGQNSGIEPTAIEDRIEQLHPELRTVVQSIIDRTVAIPLPDARTLSEISHKINDALASQMPELSDLARSKLANYYAYQWR